MKRKPVAVDNDERLAFAKAGVLSLKEAAKILTVCEKTITTLLDAGDLIEVEITSKRRGVLAASLQGYIAARILLPDKGEVPTRLVGSERRAYIQDQCTMRSLALNQAA